MKSSKGREGRNFNPSVSETVNCILHKQVSCQAVFPNHSAVPILQPGFIKQACQQACSKLSWQSLELCFSSNSIGFSLTHLRLENLENLDIAENWKAQKQILNFSLTVSAVCAVVSASLWCTTWLWRSRQWQWCAPHKSQPHGLCVCSHPCCEQMHRLEGQSRVFRATESGSDADFLMSSGVHGDGWEGFNQ